MRIVIIGGTGLIGSRVSDRLRAAGHEAMAAAPSTGVDIVTGQGLLDAFGGADVVVNLANSPAFDDETSMSFFRTAGQNIRDGEAKAGVRHHVALSVVGTEKLQESGYFRAKLVQEQLIKSGATPWTILRATQFMDFLRGIAQSGQVGDDIRLPPASIQPIAADDVADAVAAAAMATPANDTIEIGGPERFRMDKLIGRVLAFDKDERKVIMDQEARYFGVRLQGEELIPGPDARLGSTRLEDWLANAPVRRS
ncbi:NAD(P)H-binding protein [Sphingomonas sp. MAH-20]|uniref:NAD(P)H-binding protein n=1 Tax=Sphingomonas horti TaxID=2682842 RepID=A0A6I4IY25_9SPHN|nr:MULTISPECIES: SDR family oxidoreductase [Sphingomonas]MBA2920857.1 SDR family oxidoreductase [Sphingomonas sp. CGMCC 1.13658]MVO76843.1 NAD(P)H-binding protein [Sphingomonas horti]